MKTFGAFWVAGILSVIGIAKGDISPVQWHWRSPKPQGNAIYNVSVANGAWVAVGEMGTILTSTDGTNWTVRDSGTLAELRDCAYGAGKYVVVGDYGTVLTSTDLLTWTAQYASTFYSLRGLTFGNGMFVCVGDQSSILTSVDGIVWSPQSSGPWKLEDVIYAGGMFVAAGGSEQNVGQLGARVLLTSINGQSWQSRVLEYGQPFRSLVYGGGRFAVTTGPDPLFGFNSIWSSTNGADWQPQPSLLPPPNQAWLTYGAGT